MLTLQNILLFILLAFLLMHFQTIVSAFILYFWELRDVVVKKTTLEEIDESVQEIMKPNEEFLRSQGFVYQSSQEYYSMMVRSNETHHTNYYYNEALGVHAFIDTTPVIGALSGSVLSFVTFYESYKRTMSYDCFVYNIFTSDEVYLFDHYTGSKEEALKHHLNDREIEGEVIVKTSLSAEGAKDFSQYCSDEMREEMLQRGIIRKTSKGYRYRLSLAYFNYVKKSVNAYKMVKKIYASKLKNSAEILTQSQKMLYKTSEERTLLVLLDQKPKTKSQEGKVKTFLISGAFFVLFFGLIGIPWQSLPIIVAILLIHELGHFFAMKYYGYKDTSIFFIPLFGAAAKGEKEHTKPLEEYIIFLAGPLPGMILSVVIGLLMLKNPNLLEYAMLKEFALMSFVINFINLLPIHPLDGGRVVQTLIFTRYPKAQFYFFLVSLTVIIIAAISLQSILLGFFAVVLFMSINHNYNLAVLLAELKKSSSQESVKEKIVSHITANARFKHLTMDRKVMLAKQALKLLNAELASKLLMFLGMAFYILLLLSPLLLMVLAKILF